MIREHMHAKHKFSKLKFFEKFASHATKATGSNSFIIGAFSIIFLWLLLGPFLHFSEQWQLTIHLITTIITFLMVFLIQKSSNKESLAIQLKLNELIAAHELASNRLVDIENMTEEELKVIQKYYSRLSFTSKTEANLQQSHSIDEEIVTFNILDTN
mgnify:CR=1 FL=1